MFESAFKRAAIFTFFPFATIPTGISGKPALPVLICHPEGTEGSCQTVQHSQMKENKILHFVQNDNLCALPSVQAAY